MRGAVRVEFYAGRKAQERPLRFYFEERCYQVVEILDQWYGPDEAGFRVRADDGGIYILRCRADGSCGISS